MEYSLEGCVDIGDGELVWQYLLECKWFFCARKSAHLFGMRSQLPSKLQTSTSANTMMAMAALFLLGFTVSVSMAAAQSVNFSLQEIHRLSPKCLGVTSSCLDALWLSFCPLSSSILATVIPYIWFWFGNNRNTTVKCDSGTFQWLSMVDQCMWSPSSITALCTSACESSLSDGNTAVDSLQWPGSDTLHSVGASQHNTRPSAVPLQYRLSAIFVRYVRTGTHDPVPRPKIFNLRTGD